MATAAGCWSGPGCPSESASDDKWVEAAVEALAAGGSELGLSGDQMLRIGLHNETGRKVVPTSTGAVVVRAAGCVMMPLVSSEGAGGVEAAGVVLLCVPRLHGTTATEASMAGNNTFTVEALLRYRQVHAESVDVPRQAVAAGDGRPLEEALSMARRLMGQDTAEGRLADVVKPWAVHVDADAASSANEGLDALSTERKSSLDLLLDSALSDTIDGEEEGEGSSSAEGLDLSGPGSYYKTYSAAAAAGPPQHDLIGVGAGVLSDHELRVFEDLLERRGAATTVKHPLLVPAAVRSDDQAVPPHYETGMWDADAVSMLSSLVYSPEAIMVCAGKVGAAAGRTKDKFLQELLATNRGSKTIVKGGAEETKEGEAKEGEAKEGEAKEGEAKEGARPLESSAAMPVSGNDALEVLDLDSELFPLDEVLHGSTPT